MPFAAVRPNRLDTLKSRNKIDLLSIAIVAQVVVAFPRRANTVASDGKKQVHSFAEIHN